MSAHLTQVTAQLGTDPTAVYADIHETYSCMQIGPVILHVTHASPEVLEAIAHAAMRLAAVRRQQLAPKAVAA